MTEPINVLISKITTQLGPPDPVGSNDREHNAD